MTIKAIVAAYLKTESGDGYLFLFDEVIDPEEFVEMIKKDMGEELEYVYSWELNVLYGDQDAYEKALHKAIWEADE